MNEGFSGNIDLFTSELYSTTRYVYEQLTDQVGKAMFLEGGPTYFSILPKFVSRSMNGRFQNTTVIMMGCYGLTYPNMAQALVEKGAKIYISWDEGVVASHTDTATTHLLQHLITEKQTIEEAVAETMKEVGPDPEYNSLLTYYPLEVGEQTIENITGEN